ncbi:MAG: inner membrane CreD family protein [Candidatus Eremiobacteraeota bacterium]|nr:inner membrane CreD family protein [Candidatus Eremiobacteraeota bacterium]
MVKNLAGVALVLIGATAAWFILGQTLVVRTQASDSVQRDQLAAEWGSEQRQIAPTFWLATAPLAGQTALAPASSRIDVDLALDPRQKGLLWYNTYGVAFTARYRVANPGAGARVHMDFSFPSARATYDDVTLVVDGKRIPVTSASGVITAPLPPRNGRPWDVLVRYRSHGIGTWTYCFGDGVVSVHDFVMNMHTNFRAIDFPPKTLSPTTKETTPDGGWRLTWQYQDLVGGSGVGMAFPQRLQPGPLAERITFWAPLSLLFYLFVMLVITTLRRIELHPVNYFFLAAAFFAFHLLFAYTVDRIPVGWAFVICSVVSMFLTVSYLRLVVGLRFAAVEAALAQCFYLILFSYALFDEGYSGLSITIGAIVTLFVTMQVTGRIDWSERFGGKRAAPAAASSSPS